MVLTIESKNIKELSGQLRGLGYNANEVFLKLARGDRSSKFIGKSASVEQGSSGTMFVSHGIHGVISLGELEPGQMEHIEKIHVILPDNSVKPIATVRLPEGTLPYFPGDRSAEGDFGYLMEYVEGKSLVYYQKRLEINRNSPSWLSNADTFVSMAKQAIDLVNLLNQNGVAHGDLWPCNVMVSGGRAVLIDPEFVVLHKDPKKNMEIMLELEDLRKIRITAEINRAIRAMTDETY